MIITNYICSLLSRCLIYLPFGGPKLLFLPAEGGFVGFSDFLFFFFCWFLIFSVIRVMDAFFRTPPFGGGGIDLPKNV